MNNTKVCSPNIRNLNLLAINAVIICIAAANSQPNQSPHMSWSIIFSSNISCLDCERDAECPSVRERSSKITLHVTCFCLVLELQVNDFWIQCYNLQACL